VAHCTARSKRSKVQCQKWAVRGRTTCHMHGGVSTGPKTKVGRVRARQAAFRHGAYTLEAKAQHREAMALIRKSQDFLRFLG